MKSSRQSISKNTVLVCPRGHEVADEVDAKDGGEDERDAQDDGDEARPLADPLGDVRALLRQRAAPDPNEGGVPEKEEANDDRDQGQMLAISSFHFPNIWRLRGMRS